MCSRWSKWATTIRLRFDTSAEHSRALSRACISRRRVGTSAGRSYARKRAFHCEQAAMTAKKKLIEVALPLDAINKEAAREKSIRHGHPSTLHLWWARRPLAACRAVLFGQLVDDPSAHPDEFPTEEAQAT